MSTDKELTIHVEYTGENPDLRPAASAFVRLLRQVTNPDGSFSDPDIEAEFQQWMNDKNRKEMQKVG